MEDENVLAKTSLGGWKGATAWALITFMGIYPFLVPITTGVHVLTVITLGLTFALCQFLEQGAAAFFNKYQQCSRVNLNKLAEMLREEQEKGTSDPE